MCEPAHFNIVKCFLSINDREMKCESGFSLAMAISHHLEENNLKDPVDALALII